MNSSIIDPQARSTHHQKTILKDTISCSLFFFVPNSSCSPEGSLPLLCVSIMKHVSNQNRTSQESSSEGPMRQRIFCGCERTWNQSWGSIVGSKVSLMVGSMNNLGTHLFALDDRTKLKAHTFVCRTILESNLISIHRVWESARNCVWGDGREPHWLFGK